MHIDKIGRPVYLFNVPCHISQILSLNTLLLLTLIYNQCVTSPCIMHIYFNFYFYNRHEIGFPTYLPSKLIFDIFTSLGIRIRIARVIPTGANRIT